MASPVQAWELRAGLGAMEEGDDRLRSSFLLHAEKGSFASQMIYAHRSFSSVVENTFLLSFDKYILIPSSLFSNRLSVLVGAGVLREDSQISYKKEEDKAYNLFEKRYNFGLHTGISWKYVGSGPLHFAITWQSALFPAGALGGILLVTGRKQFMTIESGIEL